MGTAPDGVARFHEERRFRLVYNVSFVLFLVYVLGGVFVPADRVMLVGWITPALLLWYYRSVARTDGIALPPRSLFVLAALGVLETGLVLYAGRFPFVVYAPFDVTGLWLFDQSFTLTVTTLAVVLGIAVLRELR